MASRWGVAREEIEVAAQGATVLGHLLAAVELCARGIAFSLLDERVHLPRQKPSGRGLRIGCFQDPSTRGRVRKTVKTSAREKQGGTLTFTSMSATCMSQALSENTCVRASTYQEPRLVLRMAAVPETRAAVGAD